MLILLLFVGCGKAPITVEPATPAHSAGEHHEMPHRFDDAERWAQQFDAPDRDGWQKPLELVGHLQLQPGMTVADLGAGTGYLLPHLAAAVAPGGVVIGIEVEDALVEWMRRRTEREGLEGVQIQLAQYDDPGLQPASVDRIVTVNTWHHIQEREAYGQKLKAALKPDGLLVVVDYTMESPDGPPASHRLSPERIRDELVAAGFSVEAVEETLPRQFILRAR